MCPAPHRADPIWRTFRRSDQVSDRIKSARLEGSLAGVPRPGERPARGLGAIRRRGFWGPEPVSARRGGPPGNGKARRRAPLWKISLKAAAASIHPNPLSPCTLTANPSLRASSHTPCDADIDRASVPSHPIRPPEAVDSRGAGGIVSSQGRSFGTPALGPCREPGGQLGASTPRLAPFSYRTAAKGWTSSLCPRQGRASRADLI
jgi:hypothetical protein